MQGAQPSAKTAPSTGAPARPARGRQEIFASRWLPTPRKTRPITMTTTPPRRMSSVRCSMSARPAVVTKIEPSTKTAVNPMTKSRAPVTVRLRDFSARVSPVSPVT